MRVGPDPHHYRLQDSDRIAALKLLVVREPVNKLHDQWLEELPGDLFTHSRQESYCSPLLLIRVNVGPHRAAARHTQA